jgi:hypothetical protein
MKESLLAVRSIARITQSIHFELRNNVFGEID